MQVDKDREVNHLGSDSPTEATQLPQLTSNDTDGAQVNKKSKQNRRRNFIQQNKRACEIIKLRKKQLFDDVINDDHWRKLVIQARKCYEPSAIPGQAAKYGSDSFITEQLNLRMKAKCFHPRPKLPPEHLIKCGKLDIKDYIREDTNNLNDA